jgi:hypothetical protein
VGVIASGNVPIATVRPNAFLQEYIQQIAAHGYQNAPFVIEAEAEAHKACRDVGIAQALLVKKTRAELLNDGKPAG